MTPTPPARRTTAAMVAERAGTSVSTVSLVVNGKARGRVSPEIAARVRRAVVDLGYVVDHAASSLARGRSDLVVLLAPDLSNPFFGEVVRGVRDTLGERFQLLLAVTERGAQPSAADVRRFAALRPAGLLVDAPGPGFLDDLGEPEEPLVLLDAPDLCERAGAVDYDLEPGITGLVAHLHAGGHRVVAYLDATSRAATFVLRNRRLTEAARDAGIRVLDDGDRADLDVAAATAVAAAALPRWREDGVTAVVAAADTLAYGVLVAAGRAGLDVPGDLAVAGFDDLPSSVVTAPPLTSIALPAAALGEAAARRLLSAIDGSPDDTVLSLPTALVVRASTAGS